jgi:photosystem II stability/assembly factor-like uncharacterized protein
MMISMIPTLCCNRIVTSTILVVVVLIGAVHINAQPAWENIWHGAKYDFNDVHFFSERHGLVLAGNLLLATTDGGILWDSILLPDKQRLYLHRMFFVNENVGFLAGLIDSTPTDSRPALLVTRDGGKNWQRVFVPGVSNDVIRDIDFPTPAIGFLAMLGEIVVTKDSGQTWREIVNSPAGARRMRFRDTSEGLCIQPTEDISPYSAVSRTTDGGLTWKDVSPDHRLGYGLEYVSNRTWLYGRESGIMRTVNGGDGWTLSSQEGSSSFGFYDSLIGYSLPGYYSPVFSTILRTTDGGVTWVKTSPLPDRTTDRLYAISAPSATTAYVVGSGGIIYKTSSAGMSGVPNDPSDAQHDTIHVSQLGGDAVIVRVNDASRQREVRILSILGQLLYTDQIPPDRSEMRIDVGILPSGIYFCQLGAEITQFCILR